MEKRIEGTYTHQQGCELAMSRVGKEERKEEAIEEEKVRHGRQARWEEKGSRGSSSNQ